MAQINAITLLTLIQCGIEIAGCYDVERNK